MRLSLFRRLPPWAVRHAFNFHPAYRATGGRITEISDDFRRLRVELRLRRATRNLVGTIFGGSLYGAVDPIYMTMLLRLLGPDYVVWDKAAAIRFRKPGRTRLVADFHIPPAETDEIRHRLEAEPKLDRVYTVEWRDAAGELHAEVEKTIHLRKK